MFSIKCFFELAFGMIAMPFWVAQRSKTCDVDLPRTFAIFLTVGSSRSEVSEEVPREL